MTTTPTHPTATPGRGRLGAVRRAALALTALATLATATVTGAAPAAATTCPPLMALEFSDIPADHAFCREIGSAAADGWVTGYPDGTFGPTNAVTRQAAAAMLWSAANLDNGVVALDPCTEAPFPDVAMDHPFCPQIRDAAAAGILTGYADGEFHPGNVLTRQALASLITRFPEGQIPLPACVAPPFSDIPTDHQFCGAIAYLSSAGIVGGYADGTFRPTNPVTRQSFVVIMSRWLVELDDAAACLCAAAS